MKVTSQGERGGGRDGHGATGAKNNKNNIGEDYTEVVMHVVVGNLKLGEIKGCNRSKEKGYPVKGAHHEGMANPILLYILKGFEVRLWGV